MKSTNDLRPTRNRTPLDGHAEEQPTPQLTPPVLLTEAQARECLGGVSRTTIWLLRTRGLLSYYRIGSRVYFSPSHLAEYLSRSECKAVPPRRKSA